MEFKPQIVEPGEVWGWIKESLNLTVRHALISVAVTGLIILVFATPGWISAFLFAMTPVLFGLGCVIAAAGDESENPLTSISRKPLAVWVRLLMLGIYPYVMAIVGFAITSAFSIGSTLTLDAMSAGGSFSSGVVMLFSLYVWLAAGPFIWFFVPLLAVAEMPLPIAACQASEAFMLNRFVILLSLALGVLAQICFLLPVLVFPLVALVTSLMYVSYRHIWMGRGLNKPVKCSARQVIGAAT